MFNTFGFSHMGDENSLHKLSATLYIIRRQTKLNTKLHVLYIYHLIAEVRNTCFPVIVKC